MDDSESYMAIHTTLAAESSSVVTGHYHTTTHADATDTVHEMHLALLYLLSNPEEFQKALATHPARGATTLAEWNAEYDTESLMTEGESTANFTNDFLLPTSSPNTGTAAGAASSSSSSSTPLPFVVFADDAEVVLPQAHTASQLFGVERLEGIELEAAAGIPAISQLFLRWLGTFTPLYCSLFLEILARQSDSIVCVIAHTLIHLNCSETVSSAALMPGGDHLNIIDPPGLTVMRIAGGRYRVTAAHRVVWVWMNEFTPLTDYRYYNSGSGGNSMLSPADNNSATTTTSKGNSNDESVNQLHVGDLVTMTIVDVFETDNQGKLLSYCPTFDNRAVIKTHQTTETLRRGGSQLMNVIGQAKKSKTTASFLRTARSVARTVRKRVDDAVHGYNTSNNKKSPRSDVDDDDDDDDEHDDDTPTKLQPDLSLKATHSNVSSHIKQHSVPGSSTYMADEDLERHEV